jgi:spectinomycin phosphotransferase
MLEPPDVPEDSILTCLREQYGLAGARLTFLPIGYDMAAWAYRVQAADGTALFLKVRKGRLNEPGLIIPRYLQDHGVAHLVAPISNAAGAVWSELGDFKLILYPFVEGRTGTDAGLAEQHWVALGKTLRQVHTLPLPPDLAAQVRQETYTPDWIEVVKSLDAAIGSRAFADPLEQALAAFWKAHRAEIRLLVERAETLGRRLREAALPWVLCHADIHTWNVLIDPAGGMWIVDWDEVTLAPKERDLMFVVGGISAELVGSRAEAWFFQGYGETDVNPLALAYYRYAWAVQDIGGFSEQVFLNPEAGDETRRDAVEKVSSLFRPGEIVSLAFATANQTSEV